MISVVIPCYNETEVLRLTYRRVVDAAASWGDAFELVLVDDGSRDDTWAIIESLAGGDPRVRGLRLSRNFGQPAALGAGLERAGGDVVVVLDADLQDPPELVAEMLAKWREGYDVVYGQRNLRHGETLFKRFSADLFYRLLGRATNRPAPRNTSDFSLLDARVVKTMLGFREHNLFWRGLRTWSGFRQTAVRFDRPARAGGETKYNFKKLVRVAMDGLLCLSDMPLRLLFTAGFWALGLTALATAASLVSWVLGPSAASWRLSGGTLALFLLGSVQLLGLGVLGEYIGRIHDEVRARPRWIVADTVGIDSPASADWPRKRSA